MISYAFNNHYLELNASHIVITSDDAENMVSKARLIERVYSFPAHFDRVLQSHEPIQCFFQMLWLSPRAQIARMKENIAWRHVKLRARMCIGYADEASPLGAWVFGNKIFVDMSMHFQFGHRLPVLRVNIVVV